MSTREQRIAWGRAGGTAPRKLRPVMERFMEKVSPEPNTGCWLWMSTVGSNGYGQFTCDGKKVPAHRMAYELFRGPIDRALDALHTCDTPLCCCPDHIFPGDARTNGLDMVRKGRQKRPPTSYELYGTCSHGHPATPENVSIRTNSRGHRVRSCRACARDYWRARRSA